MSGSDFTADVAFRLQWLQKEIERTCKAFDSAPKLPAVYPNGDPVKFYSGKKLKESHVYDITIKQYSFVLSDNGDIARHYSLSPAHLKHFADKYNCQYDSRSHSVYREYDYSTAFQAFQKLCLLLADVDANYKEVFK